MYLIGLVGGIKGRLIIDTTVEVIDTIGQAMFGMSIEGEMIETSVEAPSVRQKQLD